MIRDALIATLVLAGVSACSPIVSGQGDAAAASDALVNDARSTDAPVNECAEAIYQAEQKPAALLVVLDRSSSMAQNNKWVFAAQALVQALDQDVFDSIRVGLYATPSGTIAGPSCIFGLPVACLAPPFPQVELELAGTMKSSDATGVRREIKDWLIANSPDTGIGDASPMYNALQSAISALQGWPEDGKRMLLVVTDGTLSCNEFSARPGFPDCNNCLRDWEDPRNIVALLQTANTDALKPIDTFVVGVPGADTYDPTGCNFPPYRMRLALSAIAYGGSPDHVPATCDGTVFTPDGANPTESCHFDMTQGSFNTAALAETISFIRGETLGCVFDLPVPPDGMTIDLSEVNVEYTADGNTVSLARRSDPTNPCTVTGCWDYTAEDNVELFGAACQEIKAASTVQVRIIVGCQTIVL